ncbi:MAG: hypothetical protein KDA57_11285 [Planctomycetales bacterium]|nr:hypothetical protein [Planctomycetales bacterium]
MQTPKLHWTAYLWPGLPQLWVRGSWAGLAVAVGFTALANILLLASLLYTEWLAGDLRLVGAGTLAAVWLLALWQNRAERLRSLPDLADQTAPEGDSVQPPSERDEWFREAQQCYLRDDWVAAEQHLLKLLKCDARDIESRLMLATLWRHQGRGEEALRQLDRLERFEAAETWKYEIAAERDAIAAAARRDELAADNQQDNSILTESQTDDTDRSLAA